MNRAFLAFLLYGISVGLINIASDSISTFDGHCQLYRDALQEFWEGMTELSLKFTDPCTRSTGLAPVELSIAL